jgi:RNA polymerase sigma-54 factor
VHESTVSRVINGKYLATNMGLFELKYFFSSSIESFSKNDQYSNKYIKAFIKQIIDNEEPKSILSDAKIAQMLNNKNINIARRTVVKYRESMNIGSSIQRKKLKFLN